MPNPGAATAFRTSPERFSRSRSGASWGTGEEKGGEFRRSRKRGKRGGEWRRIGAEGLAQRAEAEGARAVGSRGRRSRPRLPTAERSESAPGAQASRARRASEFRGAQATRHASPSTGESRERALRRQRACRQSAAFWPAGDNQASCRRRAGAPGEQATKRSGADARGGLPPLLLLRGERTYKNQRKARPGALLAAGPGGD